MTDYPLTDDLRARYDAPQRLTPDFLAKRLEELEGWREDAYEIAKAERGSSIIDALQSLAGAMTDEELTAARRLFTTVHLQILRAAHKVYRAAGAPDHEVSAYDLVGLAWPVFLRCLVSYNPERAHLTTWIGLEARVHFRRYLRRIRDRDDTNQHARMRRHTLALENATMAREARMPSREEYAEIVRDFSSTHARWPDRKVSSMVTYLRKETQPRRLDAPLTDDTEVTLRDITPASDDTLLDPAQLGAALAERFDKRGLWASLTTT
jgi:hypothetical protein